MELSVSLLNMDYGKIKSEVKRYRKIGDLLHIDVMDGNFVENITFGAEIQKTIAKYNNGKALIDTHLMIVNPEKHLDKFIEAKSDIITVHYETLSDIDEIIDYLHEKNVKAGIAINPDTEVDVLIPYLPKLDQILVMSVWPGKGGQTFLGTATEKLKKLKELKEENKYRYKIAVDGGINQNTLYENREYLDIVVCGSYITTADDPKYQAKILMKCA